MFRVPTSQLEPGMVLASPVMHPQAPQRDLLPRDRRLTSADLVTLKTHGVQELWVRHRRLEQLDELWDEAVNDRQRAIYALVRQSFERFFSGTPAALELDRFEQSIADLFSTIRSSRRGRMLLSKLDSFDNYLMSHSANVCYLAMLVAWQLEDYLLEQPGTELLGIANLQRMLGIGCLLHDVGKTQIPAEILNKPGRLTAAETALMQLHPILGHEMVEGQVPPAAADVVLHHHQRFDGRGYPEWNCRGSIRRVGPLAGSSISILCRIATVCDVYDAATARRCYSHEKLPVQVLHEMRTTCREAFDPAVFAALTAIVPPFPVGQSVTLSDGCEAAVVDFPADHPCSPKVQLLKRPSGELVDHEEIVNLAESTELSIVAASGQDVRTFMSLANERTARRVDGGLNGSSAARRSATDWETCAASSS